jgi:hypothetical protein
MLIAFALGILAIIVGMEIRTLDRKRLMAAPDTS